MPNNYLLYLICFVLFLLSLIVSYLIILSRRVKKAEPDPNYQLPTTKIHTPDWAIHESQVLIDSATKKAQAIISQAEIEGIHQSAQVTQGTQKFVQDYSHNFDNAISQAKQALQNQLNQDYEAHKQFLTSIQAKSAESEKAIEEMMKSQINEVLFKFEENLSNFLSSSQHQSTEAIQLEVKSARELIDTYRQQQLNLIDENIVAVLERTLSLVLHSKLTLNDQLDLVFEALEKAKSEKFFA